MMTRMKEWLSMVTLGQVRNYLRILLWNVFDSFVASIPTAVLLLALYCFLVPLANPGKELPLDRLWILCGVLVVQFIGYYFLRQKTYIDFCVGFAETTKHSRIAMGEHLRRLSMGFFNNRDAGDLSTVLLRDYSEIENLSQQILPQIATILIRYALALIVLTAFDWRMMLATFAVIVLALPCGWWSYRRMGRVSAELQQAQQAAAAGILEYAGGIQTLKAFNMAGAHFQTLKDSLEKQRHASIILETGAAMPVGMLGRFLLNAGIAVVMLAGAQFLLGGTLSPYYYMAFLVLTLTLYNPVLQLLTFIADFSRTTRSARRIADLFDEQPLPEPVMSQTPSSMEIVFDHVCFGYGEQMVLHDLSLRIPAQAITALVGPSGSGKSTITRLIARFWDVDTGEIRLGGVPLTAMTSDDLLAKISIVFQDVYLFHDTIAGNIRMGKPDASDAEVVAAAKAAACHDFIMSLPQGYDTVVGEGGSTLSGGERQRISIARAMLKDAPIVLLDEATASLDPQNEVLIQQAIASLVAEKTVVVIAHRLASIMNADHIVVLEDGRVAEQGTHTQLMQSNGRYAALWHEQQQAESWQL